MKWFSELLINEIFGDTFVWFISDRSLGADNQSAMNNLGF